MSPGDIQSKKLIIAKGVLFVVLGVMSAVFVVLESGDWWRRLGFLLICIWAFCRAYYFAFYVIGKYVEPEFKFAGLGSAIRFLLKRK